MKAEEIYERMKKAYSAVSDFHEVTKAIIVTTTAEKEDISNLSTELYFKRPNLFSHRTDSVKTWAIASSNGRDLYFYVSSLEQCRKQKAPATLSDFYYRTSAGSFIVPAHVVCEISLLDGRLPSRPPSALARERNLEKVGETSCYVLNLVFPTGESQRLSIGMKDFFIYKSEITISPESLYEIVNERSRNMRSEGGALQMEGLRCLMDMARKMSIRSVEIMTSIEASTGVPESKFNFVIPEGVRVVSDFSNPEEGH